MDSSTFKFIQDNVPQASEEEIKHAYSKYEGNVLDAISFLMSIPEKQELPKTEWDKRRDICDSYDTEMQKMLQKQKEQLAQPEEHQSNKKQKIT